MKFAHLLVPVSGISADDQAIHFACETARRDKAKVLAVHVIEIDRAMRLDAEQSERIQQAEKILAHAQQVAKSAGCSIETDLLQSRAAGTAVVDEALERGIDLIVVGVPFRKRLEMFHLGSTATHILKNAACWVWLAREAPPKEKSTPATTK